MILKALSEEQIYQIHQGSLQILEKIGIEVPHKETLKRFADSGADVDLKSHKVKIPHDLVMKLVDTAGKKFTLYGSDIKEKAFFGEGQRNYNSTAGQALWVDNIGQKRRYATLEDVGIATRFADALEQINIPGAMSDPHELPIASRCVAVLIEMLKNTTKPITFWFHDRRSAKYIVEILVALRGDEKRATEYPLCFPLLEPISPLRFPFNGIDLLYETSRISLPTPIGPIVQMGVSAPATIASTMMVENAEILAGVCITQLIKAGLPVCYGGICHAFDMSTTQIIFGGPEQAFFGIAMTQLGKYYDFPVYINAGLTDSKCIDAQAGIETGITLSYGAAAGADIFGHLGICGADQGASLDILIMQHELIQYIERIMREIDYSVEALAISEIKEVDLGGTFLDRMHTADNFRESLWFPKIMDRQFYQAWLDSGAEDMGKRCKKLKEKILKRQKAEILSKKLEKTFTRILNAAKRDLEK